MATINDFLSEWNDDKPYITASTSGSTGEPKSIRLLKRDMEMSARATNDFFGIDDKSVLGLPLSIDYIAGKMMVVRSLTAKCTLLLLPVSNDLKIENNIDLLSVVPTQAESLLHNEKDLSKVANLLIGGAAVSNDLEKKISARGINAWASYGMTETCSHVALRKIGEDNIYHALPNIEFSMDSRDCLIINSDVFSFNGLVTNDVVELVSPKKFRWLGRYDNVINSGGIKLHPEKLENLYKSLISDLPPFYLVGEKDNRLGHRLVMLTEGSSVDIENLLKEKIKDHKILPKRIIEMKKLPVTSNGKLKRLPPDKL